VAERPRYSRAAAWAEGAEAALLRLRPAGSAWAEAAASGTRRHPLSKAGVAAARSRVIAAAPAGGSAKGVAVAVRRGREHHRWAQPDRVKFFGAWPMTAAEPVREFLGRAPQYSAATSLLRARRKRPDQNRPCRSSLSLFR